jgi:hypothetical protein
MRLLSCIVTQDIDGCMAWRPSMTCWKSSINCIISAWLTRNGKMDLLKLQLIQSWDWLFKSGLREVLVQGHSCRQRRTQCYIHAAAQAGPLFLHTWWAERCFTLPKASWVQVRENSRKGCDRFEKKRLGYHFPRSSLNEWICSEGLLHMKEDDILKQSQESLSIRWLSASPAQILGHWPWRLPFSWRVTWNSDYSQFQEAL